MFVSTVDFPVHFTSLFPTTFLLISPIFRQKKKKKVFLNLGIYVGLEAAFTCRITQFLGLMRKKIKTNKKPTSQTNKKPQCNRKGLLNYFLLSFP